MVKQQWPELKGSEDPMEVLVALSRYYGSRPEFVLAGGGNTSMKTGDRLFVKGSGTALAVIDADGFVEMERDGMTGLLEEEPDPDKDAREEHFKKTAMAARVHPEKGQRPSVECVLHNLLPSRYVVHTHATLVNMVACCVNPEEVLQELFGEDVLWVNYVDPGLILAQTLNEKIKDYAEKTGKDYPPAIIMQNHGLIVCGDSAEEIRENTDRVMETIHQHIESKKEKTAFGKVTPVDKDRVRALVNIIGPALRGLLSEEADFLKVVTFGDSPEVLSLVSGSEGKEVSQGGPLTPDQIVYCKSFPLWFEPKAEEKEADLVERLRQAVADHKKSTGFLPLVVLVKGLGLFACGQDFKSADTVRQVYSDAVRVMAGARLLGGVHYLSREQRDFIEHWEVENYRRKVAAGQSERGRMAGKVAVVTGAAQGFGLEIAQHLAASGAHVALMDLNDSGAVKAADAVCEEQGKGMAFGLKVNVTDGASIADAIHQTVRTYGGFDLFISNAGVLKAESVKTQPEKDFDFVTSVNYKGYFLCVQNAAPILSVQHLARPDVMSDIIQINSKSGLVGSNKNFAYAGGKFGGIGLTQSFALELVEDGVKVNSICPGNFYDGPLWSDPENGLFVQYLRAGKVPGAKTIEDVRKAYEAKTPIRRGCRTEDVMHAIYYVVDQQFETGQAVPVTGGQVMLS